MRLNKPTHISEIMARLMREINAQRRNNKKGINIPKNKERLK